MTTHNTFATPPVDDLEPLAVDGRRTAVILGVSPRTVAALTASGELPSIKVGRRRLYRPATLAAWLAERESKGVSDATTT